MKTYKCKIRLLITVIICLYIIKIACAEVVIENYEFGIAGQWRRNDWIPLSFIVKSSNESFAGKIVAQVNRTNTVSMPLGLSYKDLKAGNLYLFIDEIAPQVSLNLIDTEDNIIDSYSFVPEQPKLASDLVILVITNAKDVLRNIEGKTVESKILTEKGKIHVSYVDSFRGLPKHWIGYSSIDTIIIKGISLDSISLSRVHQTALVDWITSGGTLLIPGGKNYQYIKNEFIESLLPVELVELSSSSELSNLTELGRKSFGWESRGFPKGRGDNTELATEVEVLGDQFNFNFSPDYNFDLIKAQLKQCGQNVIDNNGTPLVAKREFGNGRVVFMAFDYSVHPFSDEPGFSQFWSWITNNWAKSEIRKDTVYEPYRRHEKKVRELLASNLSRKAPIIQFTVVFFILYILCIFLGNYIIKRYTRNAKVIVFLNLVWITTFTVFILLSQKFWKNDILFKDISIMNIYSETNRASLNSYTGLVGERSSLHTLEFNHPIFLKSLSTTPDLEIIQNRNFKLKDIDIAPWSMNILNSRVYLEIDGAIRKLVDTNHQSSILISTNLPFSLEDVCVVYQNRFGKAKEIKKNSQAEIVLEEEVDDSFPPIFGRSELRRGFSKIIANEGLLNYLNLSESPILLGWVKRPFLKTESNNYTFIGETMIISK